MRVVDGCLLANGDWSRADDEVVDRKRKRAALPVKKSLTYGDR